MLPRAFVASAATLAATLTITTWVLADRLEDTFAIPLDHPAIQYSERPANDSVSRLDKKLAAGQARLDFAANGLGYLPSVLQQLGVSVDSQALVFSRTSIQSERISPRTPRAIYFSDDVAVGYVQNGDLELAALDPRQGVIFYSLDGQKSAKPSFARREDCLRCHQGPVSLAIPGLMISSVHPATGQREQHGASFMTDHRSPIEQRWGGWYVTGTTGAQTHLGNNPALADPIHPGPGSNEGTQNVTSLAAMFDTSRYLAPTSDLVALMTLEHQVRMTNLLIRIGWDARIAQYDKTANDEATRKQMAAEIDELAGYMLFVDEAPLRAPVAGVSAFTKTFPQRGPHDEQGRSLRDFDLQKRLFKYPLSYMIYSPAFDGLPATALAPLYQKLYDVLTGKDQSGAFARISSEDRASVLAILRDTKANLPAYWSAPAHQ